MEVTCIDGGGLSGDALPGNVPSFPAHFHFLSHGKEGTNLMIVLLPWLG